MKTKPVDTARRFIYSGRVGTTFNFADCRLLVGAPGMTESLALDALQYLTRRGELTREGSHGAWLWTIVDPRLVRNQEPAVEVKHEAVQPVLTIEQIAVVDKLNQEVLRLRKGWRESIAKHKELTIAISQAVHNLGEALKKI